MTRSANGTEKTGTCDLHVKNAAGISRTLAVTHVYLLDIHSRRPDNFYGRSNGSLSVRSRIRTGKLRNTFHTGYIPSWSVSAIDGEY